MKKGEWIVILTNNDQEIILNEIKIIAQKESDKLNIYNKLCKYINILTKLKTMTNNFELKKNDLIESDLLNLNSDNPKKRLEKYYKNKQKILKIKTIKKVIQKKYQIYMEMKKVIMKLEPQIIFYQQKTTK